MSEVDLKQSPVTGGLAAAELLSHASEDSFYGKLLELKNKLPEELKSVVEYEWA
jgi:hypothetical protein